MLKVAFLNMRIVREPNISEGGSLDKWFMWRVDMTEVPLHAGNPISKN
jgi:hypothetical protein